MEVIEQAVVSVGRLLEEGGLKVELELVPMVPPLILADRDRMMQVMVNLLANAAKFSPRGTGRIQVQLEGMATCWRVSIRDNGPGIPAEELEQVFKKFHQASAGGRKPLGTGLGLPICKQIIEHFDGRIWAECPPGGGARLVFELPCGQLCPKGAMDPRDPNHPTEVKNPE